MIKKKYPYSKVDKGGKVRRKRIGMLQKLGVLSIFTTTMI